METKYPLLNTIDYPSDLRKLPKTQLKQVCEELRRYIIEEFADYMANRPEIWYATILEICEYTKAFRQLVYSADMRTIYNPTCHTLYYQIGDSKVCGIDVHTIGPGETIHRDDD